MCGILTDTKPIPPCCLAMSIRTDSFPLLAKLYSAATRTFAFSPLLAKLYSAATRTLALSLILFGMLLLLYMDQFIGGGHAGLPEAGENLSYGLLLMAGLLTSLHCVGMCGALVVGYTMKAAGQARAGYATHLFYGAGKTLSYTTIGALFGTLGAIVTFTPFLRGMAGIVAGAFLLIFGLGMLNLFPSLSRFRIKTPAALTRFLGKSYRRDNHPFVIGLLNGLMIICGPLQAMYILAAGTGSPVQGAKMLFFFGLGTLPLMMGFGFLTSALSARVAPRILKVSGVIVMALGTIMLNRGLAMAGTGHDFHTLASRYAPEAVSATGIPAPSDIQEIHMTVNAEGFEPSQFSLRRGVPVRWVIHGEELTYCNHRIVVPGMELEFDVRKGENIIEFTPDRVGVVPWSCWMGMLSGTFMIHEDVATQPAMPHDMHSMHDMQGMQGMESTGKQGMDDMQGMHGEAPAWVKALRAKFVEGWESVRHTLQRKPAKPESGEGGE